MRRLNKLANLEDRLHQSMQKALKRKIRKVFGHVIIIAKRLEISDVPINLNAEDESDPTEQTDGHRKKYRKKGDGRIHDLSRDHSDAPNTTPYTKSIEVVMNEMLSATTEYLRKQNADGSSESSSSSSSRRAETDDFTFAQWVQLEEMKGENLRLRYKLMFLEKSLRDAA